MTSIIKFAQKLSQTQFNEIKQQLAENRKELTCIRKEGESSRTLKGSVSNIFNLGSKVEIHGNGFFVSNNKEKTPYRLTKVNNEWVLTC